MKQQIFTTQIIAGLYRGKKLELPSLEVTRSSKSRLKESFFNVLQFDILDKVFIEAFAGSGSIGLEALSREAKIAYFIEINKRSYNVLRKNCRDLGVRNAQTIYGDTFLELPVLLNSLKNSNEEIVLYIDPPFDFRDGMENIYEKSFEMIKDIEINNIFMICIEHESTVEIPETLGQFSVYKTKKFGKSTLTYLRK
ncbi:MAG: 16S rRNA (guanine(966)-N(2))-methyltransferase RsmD [Campylobacteraceae bacterium]|nr:16S rRNA (guanine(966)-N(2))-methyltransferase RsmD [Campylobacteraceae bacterium]